MEYIYTIFKDAGNTRYLNTFVGDVSGAIENIRWYVENTAMKSGYIVAIADHSLPEIAEDYLINLEPEDGLKLYSGEGQYVDVYNEEKGYIEEVFIPYDLYFELGFHENEIAEEVA